MGDDSLDGVNHLSEEGFDTRRESLLPPNTFEIEALRRRLE
jgi:hypothetical protein